MVLADPLTKTGIYRSIKLDSTRKGDIDLAVKKLNIILVDPKNKIIRILSKANKTNNLPKSLNLRKLPISRVPTTSNKKIENAPTTNINIPPLPPSFPRTLPTNQQQQQQQQTQEINTEQPQNVPIVANTFIPQQRLIPKTDIPPRFIGNTLRDIIFQVSRLREIIRHFDGILTNNNEKIIFNNFKANYQNITQATDITSLQTYLNLMLEELNTILKIRTGNAENLNNEIRSLNDAEVPLESKIKDLMDNVLSKFYSSLNIEDTQITDFTESDLYQIYSNYDLSKYPIIDYFLMSQAQTFGTDFVDSLKTLQLLPKPPTDLNTQKQLITGFILKYGLNFPQILFNLLITLIKSNLNDYRDLIFYYMNKNPWDQATFELARDNLGLTTPEVENINTQYEKDIISGSGQNTKFGDRIRTVQGLIQPVAATSKKVLTNAWRNPIKTAVNLTSTAAAGKTLYDYARGDTSSLTNYGMFQLRRNLEDFAGDQATKNMAPEYKNIFRPIATYGAHKAIETTGNIINSAIPAAQQIGTNINDAVQTIRDLPQTIQSQVTSYIPFIGSNQAPNDPIPEEEIVTEIQVPRETIPGVLPPVGPWPPQTLYNLIEAREKNERRAFNDYLRDNEFVDREFFYDPLEE